MRHFLAIVSFILALCPALLAQVQPTRSQQLNQSVAALYQAGKLDEALVVAEEIVGLERKRSGGSGLINALENLAQIKVARFRRSLAELNGGSLEAASVKAAAAKLRSDAETGELNLREAIKAAEVQPTEFREQRIALRNNLAWLLYNYQPADPESSIGFDKSERDKFEMRTRARFFKRIDEASAVYQEALRIAAETPDSNNAAALVTTYNYAEFALATGDFENALARFETCIADVERVLGKKSPSLVQPLESYIKALSATGQDDLAFEMMSKLVRVTGKMASMPRTLLNVSLRSQKAFAPVNSTGVESDARANKERLTLSGRAATVNAGLDAVLAVSTHGRQYYSSAGANVVRVPVRVVVDEAGKVIETEALTGDKETRGDAEAAVKTWRFKPLVAGGQPRKVKGYADCIILTSRLAR